MGYTLPDGRKIYIIAEGRLVNLAAGDGHPAEIMDMSFAIQALSARWLVANRDRIARELASWGCEIDVLTPEQRAYLYGE